MTLIDTHCHLNFDAYDSNRDAIVCKATDAGVTRIINPATDLTSARQALRLADTYPGVYAAVGVHPNSTAGFSSAVLDGVRVLAEESGKVVAIGEIGLDYYRDRAPKAKQWRAFERQLELAASLGLPVIIHNRDAGEDVLAVLEKWTPTLPDDLRARPGVLHSFSAPQVIADRALDIGFYLGFTGPVTFKKAGDLRRVAAQVPDDRILVETDGPFLTPQPHRGKFPNQPAYVRHIAARLAALRDVSEDAFAAQTTANAERLFRLPIIPAG
jgi:TatD DNase family protein